MTSEEILRAALQRIADRCTLGSWPGVIAATALHKADEAKP